MPNILYNGAYRSEQRCSDWAISNSPTDPDQHTQSSTSQGHLARRPVPGPEGSQVLGSELNRLCV